MLNPFADETASGCANEPATLAGRRAYEDLNLIVCFSRQPRRVKQRMKHRDLQTQAETGLYLHVHVYV